MNILLANPRGFCAGVDRAIAIVEKALQKHKKTIYVHNEVVHNKFVVNNFKKKGVIFVNNIKKIPANSVIIFSAHGVSTAIRKQAKQISDIIYDATCPLVTKVHKEVKRKTKNNYQVILIGHKNHPEVIGTLGQATNITLIENKEDILALNVNGKLSYTTQTTLSMDDTKQIISKLMLKYPQIIAPKKNDICYATQNRQNIVKKIMDIADVLIVIGSNNSSNSNRLREIAINMGKKSYLIDDAKEINKKWLKNIKTIAITAGASAPEILVQEAVKLLKKIAIINNITEVHNVKENIKFPLPDELK